jgi:hypothetical protein
MTDLEYVRVNIDLDGAWDIWRIDYDNKEARYLSGGASDNEDIIEYDGFIGDYLAEKGFSVEEKEGGTLYTF